MLENNSAALYGLLAEKVKIPQVQSVFKKISSDRVKNTVQLKSLHEKMMMPNTKNIQNETEFGDAFKLLFVMHQDITRKETIGSASILSISAKLLILENLIDQKYVASHDRILKTMERSNKDFQNVNLNSFNIFFDKIVKENVEHQKLLDGIEGLIGFPEQESEAETKFEFGTLFQDLPHEYLLLEGYTRKSPKRTL